MFASFLWISVYVIKPFPEWLEVFTLHQKHVSQRCSSWRSETTPACCTEGEGVKSLTFLYNILHMLKKKKKVSYALGPNSLNCSEQKAGENWSSAWAAAGGVQMRLTIEVRCLGIPPWGFGCISSNQSLSRGQCSMTTAFNRCARNLLFARTSSSGWRYNRDWNSQSAFS